MNRHAAARKSMASALANYPTAPSPGSRVLFGQHTLSLLIDTADNPFHAYFLLGLPFLRQRSLTTKYAERRAPCRDSLWLIFRMQSLMRFSARWLNRRP